MELTRRLRWASTPAHWRRHRDFTLAPDGSGFTFVSADRASNATNLFWYSFRDEQTRLLLTVAADEGQLEAFQIAPNGLHAAYLLRKGSRRTGRSEECGCST